MVSKQKLLYQLEIFLDLEGCLNISQGFRFVVFVILELGGIFWYLVWVLKPLVPEGLNILTLSLDDCCCHRTKLKF